MSHRPVITDYKTPEEFVVAMIEYLKANVRGFSVSRATAPLRKVSPTLITLIRKGQRRLTFDRVEEFSKMLRITPGEKRILKNMVLGETEPKPEIEDTERVARVGSHILSDWINVYVKDCFHISEVQQDESLVRKLLAHVSSGSRVEKALRYLKREGHIKKTLDGRTVVNAQLSVTNEGLPNEKVQAFHRAALNIAKEGIRQFPPDQRFANALLIALDEEGYQELLEIIDEFSEKLIKFASRKRKANRIYQFVLNVTPTGGST